MQQLSLSSPFPFFSFPFFFVSFLFWSFTQKLEPPAPKKSPPAGGQQVTAGGPDFSLSFSCISSSSSSSVQYVPVRYGTVGTIDRELSKRLKFNADSPVVNNVVMKLLSNRAKSIQLVGNN